MARKRDTDPTDEVDENKLNELEDVARGVEGSQGSVSLSPEHAQIYETLGGNMDMTTDTGNGGMMVPCPDLCNIVLGEIETPEEGEGVRRRQVLNAAPRRSKGRAEQLKDAKARKRADASTGASGDE